MVTWLLPNQIAFQTKVWWLLLYLLIKKFKKRFKKNIPYTNIYFQQFIEKYYFNLNYICCIFVMRQIAIWEIIVCIRNQFFTELWDLLCGLLIFQILKLYSGSTNVFRYFAWQSHGRLSYLQMTIILLF